MNVPPAQRVGAGQHRYVNIAIYNSPQARVGKADNPPEQGQGMHSEPADNPITQPLKNLLGALVSLSDATSRAKAAEQLVVVTTNISSSIYDSMLHAHRVAARNSGSPDPEIVIVSPECHLDSGEEHHPAGMLPAKFLISH